MFRRPTGILVAAFLAFGLISVAEQTRVDAQGLFRRLQGRMQSRLQQVPPPTQPPQAQDAGTPQAQDAGSAESRLTPVNPTEPRSSIQSPAQSNGRFGGSILRRQSGETEHGHDKKASASKPTLGIRVLATTEGTPGLSVATIHPGSQADAAGLRTKDLIIAVDGTPTPTVQVVAAILQQRKPGDSIRATILRGDETSVVTIPLIDSAAIAASSSHSQSANSSLADSNRPVTQSVDFGAEVKEVPGNRGVVVTGVGSGTSAAISGLQAGDRIVSIEGRLMSNVATFEREMQRHTPGDQLSINAVRNETLNTYDVVLQSPGDEVAQISGQTSSGQTDAVSEPSQENSLFGGIGSVLGGLFGGPAGGEDVRNENVGGDRGVASADHDTMEFGDDEPIQRAGFEQAVESAKQKVDGDPPSVEVLTPPSSDPLRPVEIPLASAAAELNRPGVDASDDRKDVVIESLREEVRRLKQRLKELEAERN